MRARRHRGSRFASETFAYNQSTHHFSISDGCVTFDGARTETLGSWMLPVDACQDTDIATVYGYSHR